MEQTKSKRGGWRPGSGRKAKHGEATKVVRVPVSKVAVVQAFLAENRRSAERDGTSKV